MSALIFTSYMVAVGFMDNILRPLLVARGLTTPKPVIMLGVIGGTIAYGIVGLFFGPHVLSVVWVLIGAWAQRGGAATEQSRPEQWAAAHMVVRALTDSGCPLGTESTRTARLRMQI